MRHESYGRRTTDVAVCVASLIIINDTVSFEISVKVNAMCRGWRIQVHRDALTWCLCTVVDRWALRRLTNGD
jgi:hypothetical protein